MCEVIQVKVVPYAEKLFRLELEKSKNMLFDSTSCDAKKTRDGKIIQDLGAM